MMRISHSSFSVRSQPVFPNGFIIRIFTPCIYTSDRTMKATDNDILGHGAPQSIPGSLQDRYTNPLKH